MNEIKTCSSAQQEFSKPLGWETDLISLYDVLMDAGEPVCPVAHTYITAHICVSLDKNGNFLAAMPASVDGELVAVPCTMESEARTSNIAPHLISDQVGYVTRYPGLEKRHDAYLDQLRKYVKAVPDDEYAAAVYKHVQTGLLMDEIRDLLPKTGKCSITGELDYIPSSYPRDLRFPGDRARIFISNQDPLDSMPGSFPGYVASQKCCHTIQYMAYGRDRYHAAETVYKSKEYTNGDLPEEDFRAWVSKVAPGKWDVITKILSGDYDVCDSDE